MNIILQEDSAKLDEVVVVGFGTEKVSNLSGAATSVNFSEVLGDRPEVNVARALQGATPGLEINFNSGSPGAGASEIRIRGFESLNGGSPLILMDNVEVNINDVNPADIETVTVLKDAASASIYGGRAAFGVILITTKKGRIGSKSRFNYSLRTSFGRPVEIPQQASPAEYAQYLIDNDISQFGSGEEATLWLQLINQFNDNPNSFDDPNVAQNGYYFPDTNGDGIPDAQVYKLRDNKLSERFFGDTGFQQIHDFNFAGGTEKSSYRVSLGYTNEDGIMVTDKDGFERYNINAYLESEIAKGLTASINTFYLASDRSVPRGNIASLISTPSFYAVGDFTSPITDITTPFGSADNVVRHTIPNATEQRNTRITGTLKYRPIDNLTLIGEYTFQSRVNNQTQVNNAFQFAGSFNIGTFENPGITSYFRRNQQTDYKALNLYADYKLNLGEDHNFNILAGFNDEENHTQAFSASGQNLLSVDLPSLSGTLESPQVADAFGEWAVQGLFGRLKYNYKEKYLLEVNGRYDGSSRFPRGDRFGFFPSGSAAWVVSREPFFDSVDNVISFLKFRGSFGEIGNQDSVGLYDFLPTINAFNSTVWIDPQTGQQVTALGVPGIVSSSFTWERIRTLNLAVDLNFFDNRLTTKFDWYKRQTLDMLARGADLPDPLGIDAPRENTTDLKTIGWEASIGWQDKIGDHFSYYVTTNVYDSQAEITRFDNAINSLNQFRKGQIISDFYGFVTDGLYTVDDFVEGSLNESLTNGTLRDGVVSVFGAPTPNPGDIKYRDLDGDGIITSGNNTAFYDIDPDTGEIIPNTGPGDRRVIGTSQRRFRFAVTGGGSFKNLDFNFQAVGVGKRDVNLGTSNFVFPRTAPFSTILRHQTVNYWTPNNPNAFYPRNYEPNQSNYSRISRRTQTRFLGDGAYWLLRNVSFGYTIPKKVLEKVFINNLRLFFAADNLIFQDRLPEGLNPEFGGNGNGAYPYQQRFTLGINASF